MLIIKYMTDACMWNINKNIILIWFIKFIYYIGSRYITLFDGDMKQNNFNF